MLTMPVYFKRLNGRGLALLSLTVLNSAACVVEQIDAVIAEHGVTYSPASTGESEGPGPSTSTGTTADSTSGETGGAETSTTSADTTGTSSPADSSSGSGDSSTGDSSTGPADPVCGDGLVQLGEACDDGNLVAGDGCQECATDSLVFISSERSPRALRSAASMARINAAAASRPRPGYCTPRPSWPGSAPRRCPPPIA